jgi:uncharacterized protein
VAELPMPTSYVNDFAHVLSPETRQKLEAELLALHTQANADVAFVTIKTLDNDTTIEDFTSDLEDKWKLGKNGQDRSAIFLMVMNPHKMRIETGYGLEALLPDAKVGRILDTVEPFAQQGDFNQAATTGVDALAEEIAADAHVTLATNSGHKYHREEISEPHSPVPRIILGLLFVGVLVFLWRSGNLGWGLLLLNMLSGGTGGDYRDGSGRDGEGGGGFGGSGGGASGGGGASRDF